MKASPYPSIVSLVPAMTEIVYYLGLEKQLIGVTEHCNYPEDAKYKYKIGTFAYPELQKILPINPDIVLANKSLHKEIIKKLREYNIKVLDFSYSSLDDVFNMINEIGKICGDENRTVSLVNSLKNRVNNLNNKIKKPRVLRLMSTNPYIVPGTSSFQYDALKLAGAQLMDFKTNDSYVKISMEQIIEFDPEVILFCGIKEGQYAKPKCKGCSAEKPICHRTINDIINDEWKNIKAVKEGRVYPLSCDILCRPSPRLIDGIEILNNEYFSGIILS